MDCCWIANWSDIAKPAEGAARAREDLSVCDLDKNDCYRYAALRNILYRKGKAIEILVSYEPAFLAMAERVQAALW